MNTETGKTSIVTSDLYPASPAAGDGSFMQLKHPISGVVDLLPPEITSRPTPDKFAQLPLAGETGKRGGADMSKRQFLQLTGAGAALLAVSGCAFLPKPEDDYKKKRTWVSLGEFPEGMAQEEKRIIIEEVTWTEFLDTFFPEMGDRSAPKVEFLGLNKFKEEVTRFSDKLKIVHAEEDEDWRGLPMISSPDNKIIYVNKDARLWDTVRKGNPNSPDAAFNREYAYLLLLEYTNIISKFNSIFPAKPLFPPVDFPKIYQQLGLSAYVTDQSGVNLIYKGFQLGLADIAAWEIADKIQLEVPLESVKIQSCASLVSKIRFGLNISTRELLHKAQAGEEDLRNFFKYLADHQPSLSSSDEERRSAYGRELWLAPSMFYLGFSTEDYIIKYIDQLLNFPNGSEKDQYPSPTPNPVLPGQGTTMRINLGDYRSLTGRKITIRPDTQASKTLKSIVRFLTRGTPTKNAGVLFNL